MSHNEVKPIRILVVGGGVTGLAAAHRLVELSRAAQSAVELTLVEASQRLGGVFGTEQVGEYTIETGADSFITNKPGAIQLATRLGMLDQLISPDPEFQRSLILLRGRTVETPVGFNLLAPSRIWPMLRTPLLSPLGKVRMAAEYFVPRSLKPDDDESLAAFVRRRFGNELLERIVQPMVGGIYTSDPERLSLQATLPRFLELEQKYGSLIKGLRRASRGEQQSAQASGARYGLFATPVGGMSDLLNALRTALESEVEIQLGRQVKSLRLLPFGCEVDFSEGGRKAFDAVVLALPAYRTARVLSGATPVLSEKLSQIEYASSAIVVSGHDLQKVQHPLNAFGLVIPHCEKRRVLAVSFLSRKFPRRAPPGKVILRTFVGGALQPEELHKTDAEVTATVLAELHEILGVTGTPEFIKVVRYDRAMPQYTVGHLDRVAEIAQLAAEFPCLGLAGNGYCGVGVPDCIESGEAAATRVWNFVTNG